MCQTETLKALGFLGDASICSSPAIQCDRYIHEMKGAKSRRLSEPLKNMIPRL